MVTYLFPGYQEAIEAKMVKYNTRLWGAPLLAFMRANGPRSYLSTDFCPPPVSRVIVTVLSKLGA